MSNTFFPGMEPAGEGAEGGTGMDGHRDMGAARVVAPERSQTRMVCVSLEDLLPDDHPARMVWDVTGALDLTAFCVSIKSRAHGAGRGAIDPRLLVALWLYASLDNVASGRKLEELCQSHAAYQWLCGNVGVNYHTLNDFRVGHAEALDQLFTQVLGRLMHAGLVKVQRICQDGLRVRASAGSGSFKSREKLDQCMLEAKAHLTDLSRLRDESPACGLEDLESRKMHRAQDRIRRVNEALAACQEITQRRQSESDKKKRERPALASTTDADARRMKMADGGFRPAYNVQIASDPESRAIVGIVATNRGGDALLLAPMREEVLRRTGIKPAEQVADGGYVSHDNVNAAAGENVTVYLPVPPSHHKDQDRYSPRADDSEAVAKWRIRMGQPPAKEIYKQRTQTSETINADLRAWRGLAAMAVRGLTKVQCLALWAALTYNLMHFAHVLLKG